MISITKTEEMLLLVVCRLQDEAFGINIRREVETLTGKRYSVGGIYVPLDRLVRKGLLRSEEGKPSETRMGRPRRCYHITSEGLAALREAKALHEAMWASLPGPIWQKLQPG